MRSQNSPARIQAASDRRNYQNFLTYNFSLNEWSGLFHSFGAFADLVFRGSAVLFTRGGCRCRQRRRQASARLLSRVPVPAGPVTGPCRRAKHFQFSSLRCRWCTWRADDAVLPRSWRTSLPTNKSSEPNEVNPHEQIITRYEITGLRHDCGD